MTVLVTRNAGGDLMDGVRDRLDRVPAVSDVADLDVHGVRPGLNDLRVEVTAELRVDERPDADDPPLADRLTDCFGVEAAEVLTER